MANFRFIEKTSCAHKKKKKRLFNRMVGGGMRPIGRVSKERTNLLQLLLLPSQLHTTPPPPPSSPFPANHFFDHLSPLFSIVQPQTKHNEWATKCPRGIK